MRLFPFLLLAVLAGCAASATRDFSGIEERTSGVGLVDVVDSGTAKIGDLAFSPPSAIQAEPGVEAGTMRITMLKPGITEVTIPSSPGRNSRIVYHVSDAPTYRTYLEVQQVLKGIEGIQVGVLNNVVTVSGQLTRPESVVRDFDRIYQAENVFVLYNTVTIADSLYEAAARQMQRELDKLEGGSNLKVRVLNGTFVIDGEAPNAAVSQRAEALVALLLPPVKASPAVRENALVLGAKKYSVRNLIQVKMREPASACPKN